MKKYFNDKTFNLKKLSGIRLDNFEFYKCVFLNCTFNNVYADMVRFEDCVFEGCVLSTIKHSDVGLIDCAFVGCKIQGVNFQDIRVPYSFNITQSHLNYVDFYRMKLKKADLSGNKFDNCAFSECHLTESNFSDSEFIEAEFRDCALQSSIFSSCLNLMIDPDINNVKKIVIPLDAGIRILRKYHIIVN